MCSLSKEQFMLSREMIKNSCFFSSKFLPLIRLRLFYSLSSTPQQSVGTHMQSSCLHDTLTLKGLIMYQVLQKYGDILYNNRDEFLLINIVFNNISFSTLRPVQLSMLSWSPVYQHIYSTQYSF